jgi:ureidoacrylate peracid hydrolase
MNYDRFNTMINNINILRRKKKDLDVQHYNQIINNFINEFGLLDFREFRETPVHTT